MGNTGDRDRHAAVAIEDIIKATSDTKMGGCSGDQGADGLER